MPECRTVRHLVSPVPECIKMPMPGAVRFWSKKTQSSIGMLWYRTEMPGAGIPMPTAFVSMPMPSYGFCWPQMAKSITLMARAWLPTVPMGRGPQACPPPASRHFGTTPLLSPHTRWPWYIVLKGIVQPFELGGVTRIPIKMAGIYL